MLSKMKLDTKDLRIMELLAINCRFSLTTLAHSIALSKASIKNRIDKLVEAGIIHKFTTLTNISKLGYGEYLLFLKLQNLTKAKEDRIITFLQKHKLIFAILKTSGVWNYLIFIASKDNGHFNDIKNEIIDYCGDNAQDYDFAIWIKDYKFTHSIKDMDKGTKASIIKRDPSFSRELLLKPKEYKTEKKENIGGKDLEILKTLNKNPRSDLKKIGEHVSLSIETVGYRIRNLIKKGFILGFSCVPDFFKLGYNNYFLFVQTKNLSKENEKEVIDFLQKNDFIVIAMKLVGKWNFFTSISARNLEEYNSIVDVFQQKFSNIIKSHETLNIINWHKYELFPEGVFE